MEDCFLTRLRRLARRTNLKSWRGRFKEVGTKKRNILIIFILVLCMGLFFYSPFGQGFAQAKQISSPKNITLAVLDPMSRVNKDSIIKLAKAECTNHDRPAAKKIQKDGLSEDAAQSLVSGYPIAQMVPAICHQDKTTAAFLIAIAKKESDWGNHAPTRNGRDCYNYWGYKGDYNLVGGYSCFDGPDQAVDTVGGRIKQLIDENINTPERMVTWKCGSSCASDTGVGSWIGTVRSYWDKLVS